MKSDPKRLCIGLILSVMLLFASSYSLAQNLPESRQSSYFTYIFRITDKEAGKIYRKDIWEADSRYFHTPVDSFPTDSVYRKKLPAGHYLKAYTLKDRLMLDITTVHEFDVIILNNNSDLAIQVVDLAGGIISDATVKLRLKRVRFDKKTQAYIDRKSNRKGLLSVSHNGLTSYYDLEREYYNPLVKRAAGKIVYATPVRYVWRPVKFIISLPVDGVKSIASHYPQGSISRTIYFFRKTWSRIACIFDDWYCDNYGQRNFCQGYLVFNKPQYLPHDTVKFKAFLVDSKGRPVKKKADVFLSGTKKEIKLGTISPYSPGGFAFEFFLHDSLNLRLDQNYTVLLKGRNNQQYINYQFRYEDYELRSINLQLTADTVEHYRGKFAKIKAKGTDENELSVPDGRLEILVKSGDVLDYFRKNVFIPDTLAFWETELERDEETVIFIPDSIFPAANLDYNVSVTLLTSSNERITKNQNLTFNWYKSEIDYILKSDSIEFFYTKNGEQKPAHATIFGIDNFGNRTFVTRGILPLCVEINPFYSEYLADADSINATVDISSESSMLECFSERSADSISIVVRNPRNIMFSYFIYKRNLEKQRGYADSLNLNIQSPGKERYYLSVQYLWGGKVVNENYEIKYFPGNLNVEVTGPALVYPSQDVTFDLLVTDSDGKPVQGADLTALSFTKKFKYTPPTVPYLRKSRKPKLVINRFSLDEKETSGNSLALDYNHWRALAGLDSIEYYRFIYPGDAIYKFNSPAETTQFAPFVTSYGRLVPAHIIYIDSKPVYFSWSTFTQPYSFAVDSGFHNLKIRTATSTYEIDRFYFPHKTKTILSFRDSITNNSVKATKEKPELSEGEKNNLHRYIFPYRYQFGDKPAWLEQDGNIQLLKPATSRSSYNFAGPVYPSTVSFHLLDGFTTIFRHEPFFEYEFSQGLLKMRSADSKLYPAYLYMNQIPERLSDTVMSVSAIRKEWQNLIDGRRYSTARYSFPKTTSVGMAKLQIDIEADRSESDEHPLNILVFKYGEENFMRIYPGSSNVFHNLPAGYFRFIYFYKGSQYSVLDSVQVKAAGLNLFRTRIPEKRPKDSFSISVSRIIEENVFRESTGTGSEEEKIRQAYRMYKPEGTYTGPGDVFEGYVNDENGDPLPGVTVLISGTDYGTVTDLEGFYSLKVPRERNKLVFSFIGYGQKEVEISGNNTINVSLTPDVLALQEVVVVGYGINRKSMVTGAVSVNDVTGLAAIPLETMSALQGRVAGVQIMRTNVADSAVVVSVRGTTTGSFKGEPLLIIDGAVYTGNLSDLDPKLIRGIQVLKDEAAVKLYGARAANGVLIINTEGSFKPLKPPSRMGADYDESFYQAVSAASSVRSNFSDYAFWQPKLTTGKDGRASFRVRFPDDVTSWKTFFLAMNGKKQSGKTEGTIKSYKPLMGQLSVPRFLIENDTVNAIGKVLNYGTDTVPVTIRLEIDEKPVSARTQKITDVIVDTLQIAAQGGDSLAVKYFLEKEDGYYDGEMRYIPVLPAGLEKTAGQFFALDTDTTLKMHFDPALGKVTFYARADVLEVVGEEIVWLLGYRYQCNEQLASKLKALLAEQAIAKYRNTKFNKENLVEKIIRLLERNKHDNGLWGWWKTSSNSELWVTLHVLEALTRAEEMGYRTGLDEKKLADDLMWEFMSTTDVDRKLTILMILRKINAKVDFPALVSSSESRQKLNMNQLLRIIELKQLCGIKVSIDTLNSFRKETIFGNVYFSSDSSFFNLFSGNTRTTLAAYRIIRNDSLKDHSVLLRKIRNYLFESRSSGCWANTYESSSIIETLLPDLLGLDGKTGKPVLALSGTTSMRIEKFPVELPFSANDSLVISKSGDFPVYVTSYQHYQDRAPAAKKSDFEISTYFENTKGNMLESGREVKLKVRVKVLKDADYVMINVPIPGGCSYGDKAVKSPYEDYRESFRHETAFFCRNLDKGEYEFTINLLPRYTGKFTLNPAKVELMYFPTFNGNNMTRKIEIR